ncbi:MULTISPECIES: indolepyruvate oxidoreductase subunit beta [Gordonibacter]|uniref:Indolepyruvate oxidoreductase subunit beta n=2 Tax=Gordonibacter TaxID=644652 RepID=A0ABT7DKD8_9ACTN|nr:indolepyruvate oxidoreductase subunit beta [Gordonibacter sp. KGMB12511]MDJ1649989.1 indolepyruvate oxidoreductase subunit beta [Gordonibacter sp. KGMB12511]HIW76691.1 indolepyruvate oxidoreductase subunit beta [Candidatus Gordonibacter avicola]
MRNVLLAGVGGQGTVLAAKVLAQAAQEKGWQVRTAETIGMAQRGGNVVSHVRMGDGGEEVFATLLAQGTADLIIAFEPAEAARVLPFLAPDGVLITATTAVQPVTAALSERPYRAADIIARLEAQLANTPATFVAVDDAALTERVGSRKVLNTVLLASALAAGHIPLNLDDLRRAIATCVKPRFIDLNLTAINAVASAPHIA